MLTRVARLNMRVKAAKASRKCAVGSWLGCTQRAMAANSLTVLWFAREGHALYQSPFRSWYRHKVRPSFADMFTTLRYACLQAAISANPSRLLKKSVEGARRTKRAK